MSALVTLEDVALGYGRRPVVRGVTGRIAAGDMIAVTGPNGSGKSTLLRGLAGELPPLGGRIALHGIGRRDIAFLPQRAMLATDFPIPVGDVVASGLWRRLGPWRGLGADGRERVGAALARTGLDGLERSPIGTLSRGQLQRALFARLLLQEARVALLDEPFTAVDPAATAELMGLVAGLARAGTAVVAVLHDLAQIRAHFPSILLLAGEAVAWGPTAEVLGDDGPAAARRLAGCAA